MAQLNVRNLTVCFGGLKAVNNLSLSIEPASILGLIGPNGAGKTTVLNCITRFYRPDEGEIQFDGVNILTLKPSDIIKLGIVRTFQNMELFSGLSVIDNILVGKHKFLKTGFFGIAFRNPRAVQVEKEGRKEAYEVMEYLGIRQWESHNIGDLPFGIRRM